MEANKTYRSPYVDNLKGLLILLVVVGHLIDYLHVSGTPLTTTLSNFIYAFHMPFFLFCSGLFIARSYAKNDWGKQVATAGAFLVIYIMFRVATWLIKTACGGSPSLNLLYASTGAWYLLVLVGFLLIAPILSKFRFGWAMAIALVVSAVNVACNKDVSFLASSRFFTYLPWFVLGYYCTGRKLIAWRDKFSNLPRSKKITYSCLALLVLVAFYMMLLAGCSGKTVALFRQLSTGMHTIVDIKWAFGLDGSYLVVALAALRLVHYVPVAIVCFCVAIACPVSKGPLAKWGENSLQVYILHLLLLYAIGGTCGLGTVAGALGISGDIGYFAFSIIGGIALTAFLAASSAPNKWIAALKGLIQKALL